MSLKTACPIRYQGQTVFWVTYTAQLVPISREITNPAPAALLLCDIILDVLSYQTDLHFFSLDEKKRSK